MSKVHKFVAEHGVEQAKSILEKASPSATHFTEALGGHYAKEVLFKSDFRWTWYDATAQAWYYDIAEKIRIELTELRQVVESFVIVKNQGGYDELKQKINEGDVDWKNIPKFRKAIEDYEHVQAYKNGEVHNG